MDKDRYEEYLASLSESITDEQITKFSKMIQIESNSRLRELYVRENSWNVEVLEDVIINDKCDQVVQLALSYLSSNEDALYDLFRNENVDIKIRNSILDKMSDITYDDVLYFYNECKRIKFEKYIIPYESLSQEVLAKIALSNDFERYIREIAAKNLEDMNIKCEYVKKYLDYYLVVSLNIPYTPEFKDIHEEYLRFLASGGYERYWYLVTDYFNQVLPLIANTEFFSELIMLMSQSKSLDYNRITFIFEYGLMNVTDYKKIENYLKILKGVLKKFKCVSSVNKLKARIRTLKRESKKLGGK